MRRERERDLVEYAGVEQIDLAAAVLLRRSADELYRDLEAFRFGRSEQESTDVRHRDEVVAAAVADATKCVVLREQRHARAIWPDARAKGGGQPSDTHLDGVTALHQQCADALGRPLLVVRQLRIGVDLAGEREKIPPQVVRERHRAVYCYVAIQRDSSPTAFAGRERT